MAGTNPSHDSGDGLAVGGKIAIPMPGHQRGMIRRSHRDNLHRDNLHRDNLMGNKTASLKWGVRWTQCDGR
jgi:hypothetical protein